MLKSLSFFVICAVAVFICFEVLQNPSKTAGTTNIFEPLSKKSDPSYLEQTDSAEPSKIVSSNKLESNIVERYRQEIEAPILEAIRAFESKDRIIISDREFGPDSRSVILEIPALNTDEIAHLHGLISTGLERLPNEVRHRASEIALKYVNSSTAYPARYKFIQLVVPSDPAKGAQMFEVYSNDRHLLGAAPFFGITAANVIAPE